MLKSIFLLFVFVLAFCVVLNTAKGETKRYTLEELTNEAECIIVGEVNKIGRGWNFRIAYVDVKEVIKGKVDNEIKVRFVGFQPDLDPDIVTPQFIKGMKGIMFLKKGLGAYKAFGPQCFLGTQDGEYFSEEIIAQEYWMHKSFPDVRLDTEKPTVDYYIKKIKGYIKQGTGVEVIPNV